MYPVIMISGYFENRYGYRKEKQFCGLYCRVSVEAPQADEHWESLCAYMMGLPYWTEQSWWLP